MKLYRYLAFILAMFTLTSCGYTITKVQPTTTIPQTTTTTVDFGDDCHVGREAEMQRLLDEVSKTWKAATSGGVPTTEEWRAKSTALRNYRSFIRSLDIPTIAVEQNAFVNIIEQYVNAYNQYMESGKRDLSVNDYIIPFNDAEEDFLDAWNKVCSIRSNTGA